MKILVLGNGFDLDHNLPTSYMDFLNFCNYTLNMDNPDSQYLGKLKEAQTSYIDILKNCDGIKDTFLSFIKNNHLLTYFNNRINKQGNNWIDFEREIKNIISEFKIIEINLKQSELYSYCTDSNHKVHQVLKDLGLSYIDRDAWDEITLAATHEDLCHSLDNFSLALEYYISVFVNTTPIDGVSPDIINFDANKVLSFNYSDTYERIYGGVRWNESVDHVHGIALSTLGKESNIILGITSNEKSMQSSYVEFEKYFQRITKRTGNEYKNWLQSRLETKENIEIMFFGHSLDSTDSDIIKDLICNENTIVYIYYYDENSHKQIVANLVETIGKESLIKYVSGQKPKIQFIKQKDHQKDNTAGFEITRDIRALYRMYSLSDDEINILLEKIKKRIETKDLSYFYSQKKSISLFEALNSCEIDLTDIESFLEICKSLNFERNKNGSLKYYKPEEWYDITPWDEFIPCDDKTSKLIKTINESNKERFKTDESKKFYAKILSMRTSEEIKNALIVIFAKENPTKQYWEQLDELISLMAENKLLEDALKLLNTESLSLPIRSKVKHFVNLYEEHCYSLQIAKQMEENHYYIGNEN